MKKIVVLLGLLALLTVSKTQAQALGSDYKTAVGVKFWPGALTIKHFIKDDAALEGLVNFWDHGFRITGLYEFHGDIHSAPGLKWYVGPGAHIGWYSDGYWRDDHHYYHDGDGSFGVDGILGLEYKIKDAPIALSLDVNPYVEFLHGAYLGVWGGLGVKFAF
jgi:hypothetical protein